METMLCSVSGMQNKENKTQVKNALKKIEGVSQVGVNLTSGTVKIDYNNPATENATAFLCALIKLRIKALSSGFLSDASSACLTIFSTPVFRYSAKFSI